MLLTDFKINLISTCSANCVICETNRKTKYVITDKKLCVSVLTLPTQDDIKLV